MAETYRRRNLALGGLVLDNPLTSGATTLTSDALAAFPALSANEYWAIILDPDGVDGIPEIAYITAHTAGANTATIARGKETGSTGRQHDRDTPWVHGPTVRDFPMMRFARRTAGNITLNSNMTWANVDTGLDLVLACQADDVIAATLGGQIDISTTAGVVIDAVTVVSGTPTNSFYRGGAISGPAAWFSDGFGPWVAPAINTYSFPVSGTIHYTVVAGDIVSGFVTFRLRYYTQTANNRTLFATAGVPLTWSVTNLGPQGY